MRRSLLFFTGVLSACSSAVPVAEPPMAPIIQELSGPAAAIPSGTSATVHYRVLGADSVRLVDDAGIVLGPWPARSGDVLTAALSVTTRFTLIADGPGGETRAMTTVLVQPALAIQSFQATPSQVVLNSTVSLSFQQAGAQRLRVLADGKEIYALSGPPASGVVVDHPSALRTRYTLELQSGALDMTQEITVSAGFLPTVLRFQASQDLLSAGRNVDLSWATSNATQVVLRINGEDQPPLGPEGQTRVLVEQSTHFELSAVSSLDPPDVASLDVLVVQPEAEPNEGGNAMALAGSDAVRGNISPQTDSDEYLIEVPAGGSLTAITEGGSFCETDTVLTIYGPNGRAIAYDDDTPSDLCAVLIAGPDDPELLNLPAGTYRIQVTGYSAGRYFLRAIVRPARCGNDLLESEAGERCDDGARLAGDGCSEACQLEHPLELTGLSERTFTSTQSDGSRTLAVDVRTESPASLNVSVEGACAAGTTLSLVRADGAELGAVTGELGACPSLSPLLHDFTRLGPGAVRVVLTVPAPAPRLSLHVRLDLVVCGNGLREFGEACDDGNTTAGDGCNATCAFEPVRAIGAPARFQLQIPPHQVRELSLELAGAAQLFVRLDGPDCRGARLDVVDAVGNILVRASQRAPECYFVDPLDTSAAQLARGRYTIRLTNPSAELTSSIDLSLELRAPGCGDGVPDVSEACEDGNQVDGDGCSSSCTLEPSIPEFSEPDNDRGHAHLVPIHIGGTTTVAASLSAGDQDYFAIDIPPGPDRALDVWVGEVLHSRSCDENTYVQLYLRDSGDQALALGGRGRGCISIDPVEVTRAATLAPGRYYLELVEDNNSNSLHRYYLLVSVR